jgi:hypothetical protein
MPILTLPASLTYRDINGLYQISLIRTGRPRQNPRVMEQAWQTSFAIVDHIDGDLKTTPRVSLSEIWY